MAEKLEEVKTYLDRKDIPLVVMFCADKESIYPEYYPESIIRGPEPIQLEIITSYLQDHTSVDVFNIRQALLEERSNYLLYPVSGNLNELSHYTSIASFFAYRELMKHIATYFPLITVLELTDLDIKNKEKEVPSITLKEKTYRNLESSFFDKVNFIDTDQFGLLFNDAYENLEPQLPVILLLRTSFLGEDLAGKFIAQTFGRTIMTHYMNMKYIYEYITQFQPDIVVFESPEYQLETFADSIARIPELP
jgi:hypothetical protein